MTTCKVAASLALSVLLLFACSDDGSGDAPNTPGGSAAGAGGSSGSGSASAMAGSGGKSGSGGSNQAGSGGSDVAGAGGAAGSGAGLGSFDLVVIGSSTAAGEGASEESLGWVNLLSEALDARVATSFTAENLAVGGYATSNLMPDSDSSGNIDDAIELEPNLIVVALAGSNDLSAGVSGDTFISRLTTLRDLALSAGIPVFFVSTAPKDLSTSERRTLSDWADVMTERFSTCSIPGSSGSHSPCVIDIFDALSDDSLGIASELSAGDGIHLNDRGHAEIYRIARDVVEPYVCSATRCL